MVRIPLLLTLLCGCAGDASGDGYPFAAGGKADGIGNGDLPVSIGEPVADWFLQQIDHGDGSLGTFWQRYWYTTTWAESANSPVIFYFCGEAACDPWYASTMADTAKALKASVVVLEHRYYGASIPYPDESFEHMKYLTIHNALEDASTFEDWARANLPLAGKWIAVGGSYSGMLAAFYRELHPEQVVGAWASSAPVNVSLSFWGYDTIVNQAMGNACANRFRIALGAAEDAYDDDTQRDAVSMKLLGYTPGSLADFLNGVSGIAAGAAQYGMQAGLCAKLAEHREQPLDGVIEYAGASGAQTGKPLPPGKSMPSLQAPRLDGFAGFEWFYQVCTEVGFYQTHSLDQGNSIMSWLIDEDYWAAQCQLVTGGAPAIDATRAAYVDGLNNGQASNLFFVNGTLDPWSALSFTSQDVAPNGITVALIGGGSHCSELENLTPTSPPDVLAAHQQFYDLAVGWLK